MSPALRRCLRLALAVLVVGGCAVPGPNGAGERAFREGRTLVESGNVEQGLARVQEAVRLEPGNNEYRAYYYRQRDVTAQYYILAGEQARATSQFGIAEQAYRRALVFDPTSARATAGLEGLATDRRHKDLLTEAEEALKQGNIDAAQAKARQVLAENANHRDAQALLRRIELRSAQTGTPQLAAALRKPVTVEFRDAPLRTVFEILSKQSGLNFTFDRDVAADARTTIFMRNTTVDDVIRFVLVANQLERKVLNETTLLIYPNTPNKTRDYRELVVKSFYLANADVKQTANMIRAVVKTRDLFVDEKLNLLVMRDTPEAVRLAERLVANQDLGEPEVMLEVEVLEVSTTFLQQLGIQWPSQLDVSIIGAAGTAGTVTLPEFQNRNSNLFRLTFTDPLFSIQLRKQDGRTNLLANPRIRVKNKDKARIHIGDRIPVITTTTTATGFVAESVNYLDVGLKLEVEPQVFLENDVAIKIGLEVSNIVREIRSTSGTLTYQVGTRNTATTLRLKDGETQVLAGLISDEDRRSANKVPGLGDLPVVGRLFKATNDTLNKTEVVLLITPRVVRNLVRPDVRLEEFVSGTEASIGGGSPSPSAGLPPPPSGPLSGLPGGAPVPPGAAPGMAPPPIPRTGAPPANPGAAAPGTPTLPSNPAPAYPQSLLPGTP